MKSSNSFKVKFNGGPKDGIIYSCLTKESIDYANSADCVVVSVKDKFHVYKPKLFNKSLRFDYQGIATKEEISSMKEI